MAGYPDDRTARVKTVMSKDEYEKEMNRVDHEVENIFMWNKWNWNNWKVHDIKLHIPGLDVPNHYNRRHGFYEGVAHIHSPLFFNV
eukprot:3754798-Ditylum_brightwellii.AAC.1